MHEVFQQALAPFAPKDEDYRGHQIKWNGRFYNVHWHGEFIDQCNTIAEARAFVDEIYK